MTDEASILVVDDEPGICWALEKALGSSGYPVTTAAKGAEALKLISSAGPYTVALVDAKLPDLDGLELAALIRRHSPTTAVILVSGYFYREDAAITAGLAEGLISGLLAKPFDLGEVRLMVQEALGQSKGRKRSDGSDSSGRRRRRPALGATAKPER